MRTVVFLMLLPATCRADETLRVKRPFLWTIESQKADERTKAYLFGTIHVPDKVFTVLHPRTQRAWDDSTAAYFEIDFVKDAPTQTKAICLPSGQRLENLIPQELTRRLDMRLAKFSPVMTRQVLPNAHVAVWPLLLGNLEAQAKHPGKLPMDMNMYHDAKRAGRKVGGLEKAGEQLTAIRALSMPDQIAFLSASLDAMDEDDRKGISRLQMTKKLYADGDAEVFGHFIEAEFARTKMHRELLNTIKASLLSQRNVRMATEIARLMGQKDDERYFFAVGIGHLVGRGAVQDELRRIGFTVRRDRILATSAIEEQ